MCIALILLLDLNCTEWRHSTKKQLSRILLLSEMQSMYMPEGKNAPWDLILTIFFLA